MNNFSISQLSQFSGIKPHTIRAWEQRYAALKPNRSEGNTRFYDDGQLRRLLNIVSLLKSDYKISELAGLPDAKLFRLVRKAQSSNIPDPFNYFVPQLVSAGMNYDEPAFEKIFSHCLLRFGMKKTYSEILCPMLEQIGLLWSSDDLPPANEHFISNLVRRKVDTAIDSLPFPAENSDTWLLFLPENEFHEIGLLMAQYLIRSSGRKTLYLGASVPFQSLVDCLRRTEPQKLALFFTHHALPEKLSDYLKNLKKNFEGEIYIAGNKKLINKINGISSINTLNSLEQLEQQL